MYDATKEQYEAQLAYGTSVISCNFKRLMENILF